MRYKSQETRKSLTCETDKGVPPTREPLSFFSKIDLVGFLFQHSCSWIPDMCFFLLVSNLLAVLVLLLLCSILHDLLTSHNSLTSLKSPWKNNNIVLDSVFYFLTHLPSADNNRVSLGLKWTAEQIHHLASFQSARIFPHSHDFQ